MFFQHEHIGMYKSNSNSLNDGSFIHWSYFQISFSHIRMNIEQPEFQHQCTNIKQLYASFAAESSQLPIWKISELHTETDLDSSESAWSLLLNSIEDKEDAVKQKILEARSEYFTTIEPTNIIHILSRCSGEPVVINLGSDLVPLQL